MFADQLMMQIFITYAVAGHAIASCYNFLSIQMKGQMYHWQPPHAYVTAPSQQQQQLANSQSHNHSCRHRLPHLNNVVPEHVRHQTIRTRASPQHSKPRTGTSHAPYWRRTHVCPIPFICFFVHTHPDTPNTHMHVRLNTPETYTV